MRRHLYRPFILLLVLAGVLSMTAWTATPAAAASIVAAPTGRDCLAPPYPASPASGLASWIDPGPDNPGTGDPFDPKSGTSLYEVYGYAGFQTPMFDRGGGDICSPFAWDPPNEMANAMTNVGLVATAVAVRLTRVVMSGDVGSLWDPVQEQTSKILGNGLFIPLIGIATGISGVYILSLSKRGDMKSAASGAGGVLLIVVAAVASMSYAVTIGGTIDKTVTGAFGAANQMVQSGPQGKPKDPADAIAANLIGQTLYQTWASETFGTEGGAAQEYGPALFKAGAFTREEQRSITPTTEDEKKAAGEAADASPLQGALARGAGTDQGAKAKKLVEDKQTEYKKIAAEIEGKYPQAYQNLAGRDTNSRFGHAFAGLIASLAATLFLLYCLIRMMWAMIVVRVGIGVVPVVALVAQFPRWQDKAMTLLMWVVEAVGKAIVFGFGFVVFLAGGIGGIMSPELQWHPLVKAGALVAMAVAFWKLASRLGMQGKARWKLPRFRKDDTQYGSPFESYRFPHAAPAGRYAQDAIGGSPVPAAIGAGPVHEASQRARSTASSAGGYGARPASAGTPGVPHLGSLPSAAAKSTVRGTATRAAANLAALPTGGSTRLALTAAAATAKPGMGSAVRTEATRRAVQGTIIAPRTVYRPGNAVQSVMTAPVRVGQVHNISNLPNTSRAATATVYKPPHME